MEREKEEAGSKVQQEELKEEKSNAKNLPPLRSSRRVSMVPLLFKVLHPPTWGGGGDREKGKEGRRKKKRGRDREEGMEGWREKSWEGMKE